MSYPTIYQPLQIRAEQAPDAVAITAPNRSPLSYEQLFQHVQHIVTKLNQLGIGRNDRVGTDRWLPRWSRWRPGAVRIIKS